MLVVIVCAKAQGGEGGPMFGGILHRNIASSISDLWETCFSPIAQQYTEPTQVMVPPLLRV